MGTTATTNLGLIKPDITEKIQEDLPTYDGWATQNGENCDTIDALFRHTNHTYVPVLTASTVNPTLGAGGFITGKYLRLFPRLVIGEFRIFMGGAGFNPGTGFYQVSLPVPMDVDVDATLHNSFPVGKAYLHDDSAVASSTTLVVMYSQAFDTLFFRPTTGAVWNETAPFTLAQNDR
ncbi:MAG TPA: hypothetical protein VGD31_11520, partial [Sphingobacteriaceae bacterium]